jgi:uncharacterized protein (TIGR03084 family)
MLAAMAVALGPLLIDLEAEQAALRDLLEGLEDADWEAATPSPGWTVLHQVRHLAHGEELGRLAAADPNGFGIELERLISDLAVVERATTAPAADEPPDAALARWWTAADGLRAAIAADPPATTIRWITGAMSRASFLSARLMETFAHGHDIAAAVGIEGPATARLRHVAHLGVATRGFSFANRGMEPPATSVRVELAAPNGTTWTWGAEDAEDQVRGPALDFCLLVTKRRHRDDTELVAHGPDAQRWLGIAQCFAGPPTDGPPPSVH